MVLFIHGDSFNWGSGNLYDGSVLASYSNVVVVTINYRLGVLGRETVGDLSEYLWDKNVLYPVSDYQTKRLGRRDASLIHFNVDIKQTF